MPEGIKTGNLATDWLIDTISRSASRNPETGEMEAGFFEGLAGSAFGLKTDLIERTKKANIYNTEGNDLLEKYNLTRSELGIGENEKITPGLVGSKKRALDQKELKDRQDEIRRNKVADRTAGFKQQQALANDGYKAAALQGQLGRETAQDQYLHSTKRQNARYAHERGEKLMNNRHERELAMLSGDRQMAIAEMQEGLQDRRMDFDRETMRMDKRDLYIAQLMRGLGELAGAFA